MKEKKSAKVSLKDVAKAAGVSKAAAGFALQNRPGVSKTTREKILRAAKKLGYVPDARISSWMAQVREAGSKDLLPLAWLNTHSEEDAWRKFKFHTPYLEGARERALQLGYRLEEIWAHQPGMTMRRISNVLYERGIEGVIVSYPARHFRLQWDHLAAVSLEGALFAPRLHRVQTDFYFNLLLALKVLKRFGYRRIGICFDEVVDRFFNHVIRAAFLHFHSTVPKSSRVAPLFFLGNPADDSKQAKSQTVEWLKKEQPDAVVVQCLWMVDCAEKAGFRVPRDLGVVHMATDDDVPDWAGICSNRRAIGATAAESVISHIHTRRFGVPETATQTLIRGTWKNGRTLLIPKPK